MLRSSFRTDIKYDTISSRSYPLLTQYCEPKQHSDSSYLLCLGLGFLCKTKNSTLKHLVIATSVSGLDAVLLIVSEPKIPFLLGEFVRNVPHAMCLLCVYQFIPVADLQRSQSLHPHTDAFPALCGK